MRAPKFVAIAFFLASTGLGATEAQACLFARCRQQRRVVCTPPAYGYAYPSAQAPTITAPGVTAAPYAPTIDPVSFLLGVVTQQQIFQVNQGGVVRNVQVLLVPVP